MRPSLLQLLAAATMLTAVLSCTHTTSESPVTSASDSALVRIIVTVDWEGRDLDPVNIAEMRAFAKDYATLPVLHYLNAAYFTKDHADGAAVSRTIASVLKPNDQRGLHIHGWKSLFHASGVVFRTEPLIWHRPDRVEDFTKESGHAVAISGYTTAELEKVIAFSLATLSTHGFGRAVHFRAGAWMLRDNVASAIAAQGLLTDSSAVPAQFLKPKLGPYDLHTWLADLWKTTTPVSQPYRLATAAGPLWEVPDNGCLADYMSTEQMTDVVKQNLAAAKQSGTPHYVVVGFHQETAHKFLSQITGLIAAVKELNRQTSPGGQPVVFSAMPERF